MDESPYVKDDEEDDDHGYDKRPPRALLQDHHITNALPAVVDDEPCYGLLSDCVSHSGDHLTTTAAYVNRKPLAAAVDELGKGYHFQQATAAAAATTYPAAAVAAAHGCSQTLSCLPYSTDLSKARGSSEVRKLSPHYVNCRQFSDSQPLIDGDSGVDSIGRGFLPTDRDAPSAEDDSPPPPLAPKATGRYLTGNISHAGALGNRQAQPLRQLHQQLQAVHSATDVPSTIPKQPLLASVVGGREGLVRDKGLDVSWPLQQQHRQEAAYENHECVSASRTCSTTYEIALAVGSARSTKENGRPGSPLRSAMNQKSNPGPFMPDGNDADDDEFRPALPLKMGAMKHHVMLPRARPIGEGRLVPSESSCVAPPESREGIQSHAAARIASTTVLQAPACVSVQAVSATARGVGSSSAGGISITETATEEAAAHATAGDLSNDRVPAARARPSRLTPANIIPAPDELGQSQSMTMSSLPIAVTVASSAATADSSVTTSAALVCVALSPTSGEDDTSTTVAAVAEAGDYQGGLGRPASLMGCLPEPAFPPPSLMPSMAVVVPPVAPKRKTTAKRPAASAETVASSASDGATVADCPAVGFGDGPAAVVGNSFAACFAQAADCSSSAKATAGDLEAVVSSRELNAADVPSATAAGRLYSHERLGASGWHANDPFRMSSSRLLPSDPFVDAWPVPALRSNTAATAAAAAATAAPNAIENAASTISSHGAAHVEDAGPSSSHVGQWLTADKAGYADRLSDSLPLTELSFSAPNSARGLLATGVAGASFYCEDDDDECTLTDNPLYASWGALDSAWDTGADVSQDESTGDDEPSTENLSEAAGSSAVGAAVGDEAGYATCSDARTMQRVQEYHNDGSSSGCCTPATTPHTAKSIYRAGYLYKQGGAQNNKGWRKRYVTFDGQVLKYFSDKKSRISKKVVPVSVMLSVENDIKETDSNRFRFHLVCINRVFWFAAETLDDSNLWASTIMQAIIYTKPGGKGRGGGIRPGGDMYEPDIRGNVLIDGAKSRRFVAIKGGRLCYYCSFTDFKFASPIHQIDMEIASVKDLGKMKLQLTTPYHQYTLAFSTEEETLEWKTAIEDSIATALSDDTVLNAIYQNDSNQKCFDCGATNPHWSVLHLVVVVCKKCAGLHRQMWPCSVKSLRMDLRVWTPDLVKLFVTYGNKCASALWECDLLPVAKITELTDLHSRQAHLQNKYQRKTYFRTHTLASDFSQLNKALMRCVQTGNVIETLHLIHSGANINTRDDEGHSPVDLARSAMQPLQTELLKHVGLGLEQGMVYSQIQSRSMQRIIVKSGHLTEVVRKEGMRRWAVLDMETLGFYQDENMPTVKGSIRMSEVVSIRKQENEKFLPFFAITLLSDGGKDLTLAADSGEGMEAWMESLHKVQTKLLRISDSVDVTSALDPAASTSSFTMAGRVFLKEGTGATWRKTWLLLRNKALIAYDIDAQMVEQADLRKVVNMTIIKQDSSCSLCLDQSGTVLVIDLPNRALYIQSDLRLDIQTWMQVIKRACQENSQSLADQQLTKDNVAVAVDTCINYVSTHAMAIEGIYRLSGINSGVTHLLESFIKDARAVHLNPEQVDVHDVANALKRYLRSLTEPLMTTGLQQQWLDTCAITSEDQRHDRYKRLLSRLPPVNYCTLRRLIGHLSRVSEYSVVNKMTITNLGTIFGPLLMTAAGEALSAAHYTRTTKEIHVACQLITYYQSLFEVDKQEMEKEQKIGEYIEKLRKAQLESPAASSSPALTEGPFILGIYVGTPEGKCKTVKALTHTTASEVIEIMSFTPSVYSPGATSQSSKDMYAVFELIGSYELERQLDGNEAVLPVTMRWYNWGEAYRRSTCLCIKHSRDLWIDPPGKVFPQCLRYNEVRHCTGKGWKKIYVEITDGRLLYYKSSKGDSASKASGWAVCDTVVYLGVEEKRNPPTRFGVTVLVCDTDKAAERMRPSNGHSFCFSTEPELQSWMSNMRYTKALASGLGPTTRSIANANVIGLEKSGSGVWNQLKAFRIPSLFK